MKTLLLLLFTIQITAQNVYELKEGTNTEIDTLMPGEEYHATAQDEFGNTFSYLSTCDIVDTLLLYFNFKGKDVGVDTLIIHCFGSEFIKQSDFPFLDIVSLPENSTP